MSLRDEGCARSKRPMETTGDVSPRPRKAPRLADIPFRLGDADPGAVEREVQTVLDAAAVVDQRPERREVLLPTEMWAHIVDQLPFQQTLALLRDVGWRSRHPLIAAARHRYGCMANRFNLLFHQMFRDPIPDNGREASASGDGDTHFVLPPDYNAHPMWSLRRYRPPRPSASGEKEDTCLRPDEMLVLLSTVGQILVHLKGADAGTLAAPHGHSTPDGFTKVYGHIDPSFSTIALYLTRGDALARDQGLPIPVTTRDGLVAAALQQMLVEFHKRWTAFYMARRYPRWGRVTEWSHYPRGRSVVHSICTRRDAAAASAATRSGTRGTAITQVYFHHSNEVFGFVVHSPTLRLSCLSKICVRPDPRPHAGPPGGEGAQEPPHPLERRILGVTCTPTIACCPAGADAAAGRRIAQDLCRVFRYTARYAYPLFGELCGPSINDGIREAAEQAAPVPQHPYENYTI